jgi:ribosomal protein S18 acetylase RimI-like enzyme
VSTVRTMREEDADAIREIDAIAFSTWWRELHSDAAALPPRTRANVLALRQKDPAGCFVAEENGRMVGFIFSRTWGGVGWFGTFAVLPEFQGRGIGKQLIAASLEYLRQDPARVIGLETMPESPYNMGLYLRQGFEARLPTFYLDGVLAGSPTGHSSLVRWSSTDPGTRARWLADLREASGEIQPALDYSKEILSTAQHSLGETLVLCEGRRAIGFSTVWLTASREGWGDELAIVQTMALHPDHTSDGTLRALLDGSEALAHAHDKEILIIPANGRHTWAMGRLLARGYRVSRAMIRMALKGTGAGVSVDGYVNFSRWSG